MRVRILGRGKEGEHSAAAHEIPETGRGETREKAVLLHRRFPKADEGKKDKSAAAWGIPNSRRGEKGERKCC